MLSASQDLADEEKHTMLRGECGEDSEFCSSGEEDSLMSVRSGVLNDIFTDLSLEPLSFVAKRTETVTEGNGARDRDPALNKEEEDDSLERDYDPAVDKDTADVDKFSSLFDTPETVENVARDAAGKIVAATAIKLVEILTTQADSEFMEDFFLTFRSFISASKLLGLLLLRLRWSFIDDDEKNQSVKLRYQGDVSHHINKCERTFVVLRHWLSEYRQVDFDEKLLLRVMTTIETIRARRKELTLADQQILIKLRRLATNQEISEESSVEHPINSLSPAKGMDGFKRSWFKKLGSRIKAVFVESLSEADDDDRSSALHSQSSTASRDRVVELANRYEKHSILARESSDILTQAMALIEIKYFRQVPWKKILTYPACGVELQEAINHFNRMCKWLVDEVIRTRSHQEQRIVIRKLIRMCLKSLGCYNFNTVMQIMLALQNPAIEALTAAWKDLSEYERGLFNDLVTFVAPVKNFRNIRKAMQLQEFSKEACVPFVGIFLADLASNNERIAQRRGAELVPWHKYQTTARIIKQYRAFQDPSRIYSFPHLKPEVHLYILDCIKEINSDD